MTTRPQIVGLDTAAERWHAVETITCKSFRRASAQTPDPNPDVRRTILHRTAVGYFGSLRPGSHIFAEEPIALQSGSTTRLLSLAAGAIWAAHVPLNVFWHWVNISTWKAFVKAHEYRDQVIADGIAPRHRPKETVIRATKAMGAEDGWDEDHYDAYGLCLYGCWWLEQHAAQGES